MWAFAQLAPLVFPCDSLASSPNQCHRFGFTRTQTNHVLLVGGRIHGRPCVFNWSFDLNCNSRIAAMVFDVSSTTTEPCEMPTIPGTPRLQPTFMLHAGFRIKYLSKRLMLISSRSGSCADMGGQLTNCVLDVKTIQPEKPTKQLSGTSLSRFVQDRSSSSGFSKLSVLDPWVRQNQSLCTTLSHNHSRLQTCNLAVSNTENDKGTPGAVNRTPSHVTFLVFARIFNSVARDIGPRCSARHIIHVSCACVFDLSSTLHFALFTISLIFYFILLISSFFYVGRFREKFPVRFREWGVWHFGQQRSSHRLWVQVLQRIPLPRDHWHFRPQAIQRHEALVLAWPWVRWLHHRQSALFTTVHSGGRRTGGP